MKGFSYWKKGVLFFGNRRPVSTPGLSGVSGYSVADVGDKNGT